MFLTSFAFLEERTQLRGFTYPYVTKMCIQLVENKNKTKAFMCFTLEAYSEPYGPVHKHLIT